MGRIPKNDRAYLAWCRRQPCAWCGIQRLVYPHHHTRGIEEWRGKGQKAPDREAFPLCYYDHRDFHAAAKDFKDWDKEKRIEWQTSEVVKHRVRYLARHPEAHKLDELPAVEFFLAQIRDAYPVCTPILTNTRCITRRGRPRKQTAP